ncbi:hypothetical protein GCM10028798_03060 [Humibacter antri]
MAIMVVASALCFAGAGYAARKWSASVDSYMRVARAERSMREPESKWFSEQDKVHKARGLRRADRKQQSPPEEPTQRSQAHQRAGVAPAEERATG